VLFATGDLDVRDTAAVIAATKNDRLRRVLELQELLLQVSRSIGPALELQPVLGVVLDAMRSLVRFRGGSIQLAEDGMLRVAAADPPVSPEVARARLPVGSGLSGRVIAESRSMYSPDVGADPLVDPTLRATGSNAGMTSYLAVPLVCLGETIGVLQVDSPEVDAFDDVDRTVLEGLATLVAGAIESARRYEELVEIERMKGDFIARVSHELRTPLAIMSGFNQLLLADDGIDSAHRRDILGRMARANQRLTDLIDELLTAANVDAGMAVAKPEDVDVAALFEQIREDALDPCRVTVICPEGLRRTVDPRILRQIMNALVDNAMKYAGEAELRADESSISVRDHGPGIPGDLLPHIFERFTRGDSTKPGMGLGLPLCRRLAMLIGAGVEAANAAGGGACFTLVFDS
jgi:signal transduction histidine kinase